MLLILSQQLPILCFIPIPGSKNPVWVQVRTIEPTDVTSALYSRHDANFVYLCSASNYLLGATPLKFSAYLLGSLIGLSFWCTLFAAVGSAGRELFLSGASLDVLLEDLLGKAGNLTETAGVGMACLGLGAAGYFAYNQIGGHSDADQDVEQDKHKNKCKQT